MDAGSQHRKKEGTKARKAFVLAPPIGVACALLTANLWYLTVSTTGSYATVLAVPVSWTVITLGAYAAAALLGIPAYLALRSADIRSPWVTIIVATLIAIIAGYLLGVPPFREFEGSAVGQTFSYFAEGCQVFQDNVTTRCGRLIYIRDGAGFYLSGAFAGLFFWIFYAGGWRWRA